ncbi:hypothetical protein IT570_01705 [Candidatus Sumerlaeota bacterium]|nr:hypothetical protein [Candidatus Sumerlaeota bacterium]
MEGRLCDSCGRWIEPNEILYNMTVTIEASDVVNLEDNRAADEIRDEFEKLVRAMEQMTSDEIDEATDEVHEDYRFSLCRSCRNDVHKRLKNRVNITGNY